MGPASPRALVVVDVFGPSVARMLSAQGFAVDLQDPRSFRSLDERAQEASLLVTDLHAPEANAGVELVGRLREVNPDLPVIFLADHLNSNDVALLDREMAGCPTIQSPPNGRLLAMAVAAARSPTPSAKPAPQRRAAAGSLRRWSFGHDEPRA